MPMNKRKINLDQVQIARSCSNDWESLTGNDRVRFCGECNKNVYNFTAMTRSEAENLIRETAGNICARIIRDVEGFVVTAKSPIGLNLIPLRASKIASAVVATALSVSSVSAKPQPHNGVNIVQQADQESKNKAEVAADQKENSATLKGTVFDTAKAVIVGAEVKVINKNTSIEYYSKTGEDGTFVFPEIPLGSYIIEVTSIGFKKYVLEGYNLRANKKVQLDMALQVGTMGGPLLIDPAKLDPSVIPADLLRPIGPKETGKRTGIQSKKKKN
jgi:hypothetical protein